MQFSNSDPHVYVLQRLVEVSQSLNAYQELGDLLQCVVNAAAELTQSEASSLLLFDEESGHLKFTAASWFPEQPDKRKALEHILVPLHSSVAGQVFTRVEPMVVKNAKEEPRVFDSIEKLMNSEVRTLAAVPVTFQEQVVGVLEGINKQAGGEFLDLDIEILQTLSAQASVAIYTSHLIAKTQHAYDQLAELDRMKSDFIAITSHELRTPLGLVLGHATLLRETVDAEIRPQLEIIVRNAKRLKEIVEDLSTMDNFRSGVSRVRNTRIAIPRLIEKSISPFEEFVRRKKLSLQIKIEHHNLFVDGDEDKLALVVTNLVKNAITFTPEGGEILIVGEALPGYVKISVIDNGIGIPRKDLGRIFERFYQVQAHMTRRHGGMGLGLSVAKDMVEIHGGRIWAESIEGQGSNFSFLLPVNIAPVQPPRRTYPAD